MNQGEIIDAVGPLRQVSSRELDREILKLARYRQTVDANGEECRISGTPFRISGSPSRMCRPVAWWVRWRVRSKRPSVLLRRNMCPARWRIHQGTHGPLVARDIVFSL